MSWFYPLAFFLSFSARTPSTLPNPYDYEISTGFQKSGLTIEKQWERELGRLFTQENYRYNHKRGNFDLTESYFYDGSTGLNYNKVSATARIGGVLGGYGLYHIKNSPSHRLVAGYSYDKRFNFIITDGKVVLNLEGNTDFENYGYAINSDITFGILRNFDLVFTLKAEELNKIKFFQGKISIKINLLEVNND